MNNPFLLLIAIALFCMVAGQTNAEEIANGIYAIAEQGTGPKVERTSGGTIYLTKKLSKDLGTPRKFWSMSNQNERFRLLLSGIEQFDTSGQFAIYIDGICEVVSAHTDPTDAKPGVELDVILYGRNNAERIAAHLGTQLELRKHPGYQLAVAFEPTRAEYKLGGPIIVELQIKNAGETTVYFGDGGQQRGPRNNQFSFISNPPILDTGDAMDFGGMSSLQELKPGETFRKQVDITKWFKFKKPLRYEITGLYELEFHDKEFSYPSLWDDIVVGRCTVSIVK